MFTAAANLITDDFLAKAMNSIANRTNLYAKRINSFAKIKNSIAKVTNSITKTCPSLAHKLLPTIICSKLFLISPQLYISSMYLQDFFNK